MSVSSDRPCSPDNPSYRGFFQHVFTAQLVTGSVGLLGLLIVVSVNLSQSRTTTLIAERLAPSAGAADQMLLGVNRTVAALRGWVTLGDSRFLAEWKAAWKQDINPAQAQLLSEESLRHEAQTLNQLTTLMRNLMESQWWVKDVARTPGNESARVMQMREITPLIRSIERNLEANIQLLQYSTDAQDRERILVLTEILWTFGKSYVLLDRFIHDGKPFVKKKLRQSIAAVTAIFEDEHTAMTTGTAKSSPYLVAARGDFNAYSRLVDKIIQLREAPDWNISQYLLSTRTIPMANQASDIIKGLSNSYRTQLQREAETGVWASQITVFVALAVFVLMSISTFVISWLTGKRLTRPVAALASAAQRFSEGKLDTDIPVPPISELAELTKSFNRMRCSMDQAINELNQSNYNLERRTTELDMVNRELESFSHSVAHDLRAPLRAIDGFSQALLEDYGDQLDGEAMIYLQSLREGSQDMSRLIDDLLKLSRSTRGAIACETFDLSQLVAEIVEELRQADPERNVITQIEPGVLVSADPRLLRVVMENLLGNAWKFTAGEDEAHIEFGTRSENGRLWYYVRDNGVGFDMAYRNKLFTPFQRLHSQAEFTGSGIGLSTVQRIINRHGGAIRADGVVGEGACFTFELDRQENNDASTLSSSDY